MTDHQKQMIEMEMMKNMMMMMITIMITDDDDDTYSKMWSTSCRLFCSVLFDWQKQWKDKTSPFSLLVVNISWGPRETGHLSAWFSIAFDPELKIIYIFENKTSGDIKKRGKSRTEVSGERIHWSKWNDKNVIMHCKH